MSTAACSVGFIQTTLEPHLATLDPPLTSLQVSKFLAPYIEWPVSDWSILHGDGRIIWSEPSPVGLSLRSQGRPVSFCAISHDIQKFGDSNFLSKQGLKNSSKLVMGTGAVLIVLGFMIMGQYIKGLQFWSFLLYMTYCELVQARANGCRSRSPSRRSSAG